MSSRPSATLERRRPSATEMVWGGDMDEHGIAGEIEGEATVDLTPSVLVDGDRLEINSKLLDIGRVYTLQYLGSQMVLWKSPNGDIDLYEIIE